MISSLVDGSFFNSEVKLNPGHPPNEGRLESAPRPLNREGGSWPPFP
jgi:hypothetical protein